MKKYKTRAGVVLIHIQSEAFLVASKDAREHCPYMMQVNESSAYIWRLLEKGSSCQDCIEAVCDHYDISDREEVSREVLNHINILNDYGYLTEITEEMVI